ncbi:MAG: glycine oxidase ThiO [Acidimicrobiales bacterium]
MGQSDLLVIGGGVIGLASAWRARQAGAEVVLLDPSPGHGASWAAAGMLAAVTEAHFGEESLLGLNRRAAAAWPAFRHELEAVSGHDVAYRDDGTLAVAFDGGDRDALHQLYEFQQELGLGSTWLEASECRDLEPLLAPAIRGGLFVPLDHHVDPRRVVGALAQACRAAGVRLVADAVAEVTLAGERVVGARCQGGEVIAASTTLLAAGWQSAALPGLPARALPPVRPVKGQILRLRLPSGWPVPRHTVRAISQGTSLYVVVRPDGEIVCGATVEEMGADRRVTGGAIYSLMRDARLVLPMLLEAEFVEATAGLRPGSPDNAPMIGPGGLEGLLIATGHYRNGILLAPVTAELIAGLMSDASAGSVAELPGWAMAFDPRRFQQASAAV